MKKKITLQDVGIIVTSLVSIVSITFNIIQTGNNNRLKNDLDSLNLKVNSLTYQIAIQSHKPKIVYGHFCMEGYSREIVKYFDYELRPNFELFKKLIKKEKGIEILDISLYPNNKYQLMKNELNNIRQARNPIDINSKNFSFLILINDSIKNVKINSFFDPDNQISKDNNLLLEYKKALIIPLGLERVNNNTIESLYSKITKMSYQWEINKMSLIDTLPIRDIKDLKIAYKQKNSGVYFASPPN